MESLWPPAPPLPRAPVANAAATTADALAELYLDPERFFRDRLDAEVAASDIQRMAAAFALGLVGAFDLVEQLRIILRTSWPQFGGGLARVAILLVTACLVSPFSYFVGRALFRLRLRLCGVHPDPARSATVFRFVTLAGCAPLGAALLMSTLTGASTSTPAAEIFLGWFILSLAAWNFWINYVAARAAFGATPVRALFWFVVGPSLMLVYQIWRQYA